jgi:hypothetical protein
VERQVAIIYAGTNGYLDNVALADLRVFEIELYKFIETRHPNLFSGIAEKKQLDDQLKAALDGAVKEFAADFASRKAAAADGLSKPRKPRRSRNVWYKPVRCSSCIRVFVINSRITHHAVTHRSPAPHSAVKNTQQITKVMKMVAVSKLRRAQDRIISASLRAPDAACPVASPRASISVHLLLAAYG